MKILIRIVVTAILFVAGIYLLGSEVAGSEKNESRNDEVIGIMLLASAWVFNVWQGPKLKKVNMAALFTKEIERNIKQLEKQLDENSAPAKKIELAEMYLRINKGQQAIKILEDYDKEMGENIHSDYLKIVANFSVKDFKKAWENVEKVFSKDPNYDDHRIKLWAARCYIELLEPENALNMINEYTKSAGMVAEAFYVKGLAYARLGKMDQAAEQKSELDNLSTMVQKVRKMEIQIFSKALQKEIEAANSKKESKPE